MPVPTPPVITEPFGKNAGGSYITLPIPVASQISITPGAASFNDGFVPLNMTDPTSGGIPPFGKDMNGILYMISAHAAAFQGGQLPQYDASVATAIGGYAQNAMLRPISGVGVWMSTVNANTSDPDTGGAGWARVTPPGSGYVLAVPPAGTSNDYAPTGFGGNTGVLDLNPTGGSATITGLAAGADGQRVIVTNVHATNSVTLSALSGTSSAANRFRLPADITLLQYSTLTIQYSVGAGLWIAII